MQSVARSSMSVKPRMHGIALVSVLWVVTLLAIVATGLSSHVRTETRMVGNTIGLLQAQYAVEGGVELAALNLMYPQTARWPVDGSIREVNIGDARVRIASSGHQLQSAGDSG